MTTDFELEPAFIETQYEAPVNLAFQQEQFLQSTETPAGSTSTPGKVQLATQVEVDAGVNTAKVISPATFANSAQLAAKQPIDGDLTAIAALSPADDDFIQRKAGAWSNRTVAQANADLQGTGLVAGAGGFRNLPQNSKSVDYTTVAADSGKHILHPSGDNTPRIFTIDSNANVAYPIGTVITFINEINTVTIAITSDTMTLLGAGGTGSRTLAANGIAFAIKVTATSWVIHGTNLT